MPGVTLIEVTVVIVVLLTLIWVFYFSAKAYVKESNRTACITNQAQIQKGVRGYQSLNQLAEASDFKWGVLNTEGYMSNALKMVCPTDHVNYVDSEDGVVPSAGKRAAPCLDPDYATAHTPTDLGTW